MRNKLMTAVLITMAAGAARAQDTSSTAASSTTPGFVVTNAVQPAATVNEHGRFGIGPLFGEPIGIGMKLWLSDRTAVDAGAGWSFADPDGFQLHGDFLYHALDLLAVDKG